MTARRQLRRGVGGVVLVWSVAPAMAAQEVHAPVDWARLWSAPGVDSLAVTWLRDSIPEAVAREAFALVGRLSKPEAAQLLPALATLDGTSYWGGGGPWLDSLRRRPPAGDAGVVRVAYLTARNRMAELRPSGSTYQRNFRGTRFSLPTGPARPASHGVELRFDFEPFETLLALAGSANVSEDSATRIFSARPFQLMVQHRSQSFYPFALTTEQLALMAAHVTSDHPLDRLYRFARPGGLYHFTDLREHAAAYRRLIDTLRAREREITEAAAATIAQYVPRGTRVQHTVTFIAGDGADGWAAGSEIAAIPLEYYKDDYPRMLNTIVHELFHIAHNAVAQSMIVPARTGRDSLLGVALRSVMGEGIANYIAPSIVRSDSSAAAMADRGRALLDTLMRHLDAGGDERLVQGVLNRGVASGGPFYWLGAAMTQELVADGGAGAIGELLRGDGVAFARAYLAAARRLRREGRLLSPSVEAAVERME